MPMAGIRSRFRVLCLGCLVAVASCSGARATTDESARSSPTSPTSTSLTNPSADVADVYLRLLIGGMTSLGGADNIANDRAMVTLQAAVIEPFVSKCVTSKGFRYTPLSGEFFMPIQAGEGLSEADYRRHYGFGITTTPSPPPLPTDPNDAYAATLSESGPNAFFSAVSDCQTSAKDAVDKKLVITKALQTQLDSLTSRIHSDPGLQAEISKYASCMSGRGFSVASPADARLAVKKEADSGRLKILDLQAYEISVAEADLECGAAYQRVLTRLRDQAEKDFLAQYRALLPADLSVES